MGWKAAVPVDAGFGSFPGWSLLIDLVCGQADRCRRLGFAGAAGRTPASVCAVAGHSRVAEFVEYAADPLVSLGVG